MQNQTLPDDNLLDDVTEDSIVDSDDDTGTQSESGSNPDLESDDNMLDNEHDVGLANDADEDNPKPLNIGHDVNDAEEFHRTH